MEAVERQDLAVIKITLKTPLSGHQQQWLTQNVGPRLFYLHNQIGGTGWVAKQEMMLESYRQWTLTFEDDRLATAFLLKWK